MQGTHDCAFFFKADLTSCSPPTHSSPPYTASEQPTRGHNAAQQAPVPQPLASWPRQQAAVLALPPSYPSDTPPLATLPTHVTPPDSHVSHSPLHVLHLHALFRLSRGLEEYTRHLGRAYCEGTAVRRLGLQGGSRHTPIGMQWECGWHEDRRGG